MASSITSTSRATSSDLPMAVSRGSSLSIGDKERAKQEWVAYKTNATQEIESLRYRAKALDEVAARCRDQAQDLRQRANVLATYDTYLERD